MDQASLIELFSWTAEEFDQRTQGSPIRRAGYEGWLRNIAVALGNGHASEAAQDALTSRLDSESEMVQEHVQWALEQLQLRAEQSIPLKPLSLLNIEARKIKHLH